MDPSAGTEMLPSTKRKSGPFRYVVTAYTIVIYVVWNAVGLYTMIPFFKQVLVPGHQGNTAATPGTWPMMPMFYLMPFALVAIWTGMSAFIHPLKYSIFGALLRTPLPAQMPIATTPTAAGRVKWCSCTAPFVSWSLFEQGIGLTFHPYRPTFLPFAAIDSISDRADGWKVIAHRWPEIRGPIALPPGAVADGLAAAYLACRQGTLDSRPP